MSFGTTFPLPSLTKFDDIRTIITKLQLIDQFIFDNNGAWMTILQHNGLLLEYTVPKTEDLCYTAVVQNGMALQFVPAPLQSLELCRAALQQNGLALQFVIEQTPVLCATAIVQNENALQLVKNRTPDLYMLAVCHDETIIRIVQELMVAEGEIILPQEYVDVCMSLIRQRSNALYFIKYQNLDMCELAVSLDPNSLCYVNDKTPYLFSG